MASIVECEGAPRDLGWDWGRACARELRERCPDDGFSARLRGLLLSGDRDATRALRDIRRHFPQQSEWLEGLARGAGLSTEAASRQMLAELAASAGLAPPVALERDAGPWLAATLADDVRPRRCRPEGRFASLELAGPALPTARIGVNEAGLAAAVASGAPEVAASAAPAPLLVRDCLERFESVEPALEWCLGRPVAGGAALLLVDAGGAVAGVDFRGGRRRVIRPAEGLAVAGTERQALEAAKALGGLSLGGPSLGGATRSDALEVFFAILAPAGPDAPLAVADPTERRLWLPGADDWLAL